jgi:hypothetical protein
MEQSAQPCPPRSTTGSAAFTTLPPSSTSPAPNRPAGCRREEDRLLGVFRRRRWPAADQDTRPRSSPCGTPSTPHISSSARLTGPPEQRSGVRRRRSARGPGRRTSSAALYRPCMPRSPRARRPPQRRRRPPRAEHAGALPEAPLSPHRSMRGCARADPTLVWTMRGNPLTDDLRHEPRRPGAPLSALGIAGARRRELPESRDVRHGGMGAASSPPQRHGRVLRGLRRGDRTHGWPHDRRWPAPLDVDEPRGSRVLDVLPGLGEVDDREAATVAQDPEGLGDWPLSSR